VNADSGPQVPDVFNSALTIRIASALVMIPPALAAIYFGSPWFDLLICVGALVLAWEWTGLTGCSPLRGWLVAVATGSAVLAIALSEPLIAIAILMVTAIVIVFIRNQTVQSESSPGAHSELNHPIWSAVGVVYIGIPCVALVWLRGEPIGAGRDTILWLFLVIWAADCGAYLFGRVIGGPLLAPTISPKKTWSGLIGSVACAGAMGGAFAATLEKEELLSIALFSAILGVVEQGGDLGESWLKRRSGRKDSSRLIPGHGGLFDRVDGLLVAAVVVAFVALMDDGEGLAWM
jgi:phosphatidate cytidylyltransferase